MASWAVSISRPRITSESPTLQIAWPDRVHTVRHLPGFGAGQPDDHRTAVARNSCLRVPASRSDGEPAVAIHHGSLNSLLGYFT